MNEVVVEWGLDENICLMVDNFEKKIKNYRHYELTCNYCGEPVVFVKDRRGYKYFKHKRRSCLL